MEFLLTEYFNLKERKSYESIVLMSYKRKTALYTKPFLSSNRKIQKMMDIIYWLEMP